MSRVSRALQRWSLRGDRVELARWRACRGPPATISLDSELKQADIPKRFRMAHREGRTARAADPFAPPRHDEGRGERGSQNEVKGIE
jgi:hypothetical protein